MEGDHNGLGMEPAAISGIYAANNILGKTVDENPGTYASVSTALYAVSEGPGGTQETLANYGAVAADAGQTVVQAAKDNKGVVAAAAVGAAALTAAVMIAKRK